jgi:hypothetical protein
MSRRRSQGCLLHNGFVSYPKYTHLGHSIYIDRIIGGVQVSNNFITTAKALKLTFNLESERSSLSNSSIYEVI